MFSLAPREIMVSLAENEYICTCAQQSIHYIYSIDCTDRQEIQVCFGTR